MKPTYWRDTLILWGIILVLFYPLFYTHYFYTDEITQLRHFRKGANFHMFAIQGRYLTDSLFSSLFSTIDNIRQITGLRLFSLVGWMVAVPVWYMILAKVARQEQLSRRLPFFTVLYLVASPPFCVGVSWASCMELFIANTAGLMAGYSLYAGIKYVASSPDVTHKRMELSPRAIAWTLLWGIISLFTYQNGFGCFLLPFLLHLLSKKEWSRTITTAIGFYFFTFLLYYAMFRWQMQLWHINADGRTGLTQDPLNKIAFFFGRPLAGAFRFTYIVRENSPAGEGLSVCILLAWLLLNFFLLRSRSISFRLRYGVGLFTFLGLIYLPSLVVKENYASNRTLLGLDMAVFLLVFTALLELLRAEKYKWSMAVLLGTFFVINAGYNFRYQFLAPVKKEYDQVRNYIETQHHAGITNIAFIRPPEQLFQKKYGINISWDEFGVPSTFREWIPEDFVRQVIWEKTGSKAATDSLIITNWADKQAYLRAGPSPAPQLTIEVEKILQ